MAAPEIQISRPAGSFTWLRKHVWCVIQTVPDDAERRRYEQAFREKRWRDLAPLLHMEALWDAKASCSPAQPVRKAPCSPAQPWVAEYHYQEWSLHEPAPVDLPCRFQKALEFHLLVERGDAPGTFYGPEPAPIVDVTFTCNDLTMFHRTGDELHVLDKVIAHRLIPEHIAHYTFTYQTWEAFLQGRGQVSPFFPPSMRWECVVNLSPMSATLQVTPSPSLQTDRQAKVCLWILGATPIRA